MYPGHDVLRGARLCGVLPQAYNPKSNHEKNISQAKSRDILQNSWILPLQSAMVVKN